MPLDKNVTISGADPQNIRTPGHAILRLAQIKRDVAAMHEEVGRINHLIGLPVVQYLTEERGVRMSTAQERLAAAQRELSDLRDHLDAAHDAATSSIGVIEMSGVPRDYRYVWRPARSGRQ